MDQSKPKSRSDRPKQRPTSMKDLFNIAHAIAQTAKPNIRMPEFSIQKKDIK